MNVNELVEIVAKSKTGDKEALAELYSKSYNDIYYFALSTVKDPAIAEDILQEVSVEIIKHISNLKESEKYKSWVMTITYNKCTKYFSKKKKKKEMEIEDDSSELFENIENEKQGFMPEADLDSEEFKLTIQEMINSLSEEQRSATLMYYFNEMSVREIASVQDVSEGTVKSRLNYARKSIKLSVEKYQEEHGIKLYSVGTLPLMAWFFKSYAETTAMSQATATASATIVAETIGVSVETISTSSTVATNFATTSASNGILAEVTTFFKGLASKAFATTKATVITLSVATVVVGTGTVATVAYVNEAQAQEEATELTVAEQEAAKKEDGAETKTQAEADAVAEGATTETAQGTEAEATNNDATDSDSDSTSTATQSQSQSSSNDTSNESNSSSGSSSNGGSSSSKPSTPATPPASKPEPKPEPTPPPVEETPAPTYPEGRNAQEQEVINIAKSYGYTVKQTSGSGQYNLNITHPTDPKLGIAYCYYSNGDETLSTYWNTTDSAYKNFVYDVCYAIGYPGSKQELINLINSTDGYTDGEGYWLDTSGDFLGYGTTN